MNEDVKPQTLTDAWFKELENRLDWVRALLGDAEIQMVRSLRNNSEVHRHLSLVKEAVAGIEHRVGGLLLDPTPVLEAGGPPVEYRAVPGFPGYRVGVDGSVWGSRRAGRGYGHSREWRALKPYLVRPGPAPTVSLYRERERHSMRVSVVVLMTFVGPCPEGHEAEYTNGDYLDNRLENLRYVPVPLTRAS